MIASALDALSFGFAGKLPVMLQTEAAECGLACLGMIAAYHGHRTDLSTLRHRFQISQKGATLAHLQRVAGRMKLASRAVKLDLNELHQLRLPCILHWDFNHFVVLRAVGPRHLIVHDPAFGMRRLPLAEASRSFTGVALELWPDTDFRPMDEQRPVRLGALTGSIRGLSASLVQVLLALSLEVVSLISPFFLQWVVDNVIVSADRDLLTTLALGFGLLMLLQQAIATIRAWVIMYLGTTLNIQWRANAFAHLTRLPVQYFEKRHLGDVVSRFGAIDQIQRTMTTSFIEAVLDGIMTIATLAMMFLYSAALGWIALGAMLLYALSRLAWYRPLRAATEEQIIHAAKQQSHFLESVRGIKAIKLFQRQDERRAAWLSLLVDQINADLRTQKLQLLLRLIHGLLFGLENILVIWLGAHLVIDGHFTVGALMAFQSWKGQFDSRVGGLIDRLVEVRMLRLHGARLADIVLSEPEDTACGTEPDVVPASAADIEITGLRFRYAEQEAYVLDGVDLRIRAGESVAIIGPSGGGKSTLINIMLGILAPTEGSVRVGGQPVTGAGLARLRTTVGTVLQDDALFAGSIAENISFFDPHADFAHIVACARMAAVAEDIEAMPMAWNTLIGDMGTVLSGGQKQRILLARALYKRPKILILDEATSHLDLTREHAVNAAVKSLAITRVIVAHRPETIASADRVVVLVDGKVRQDGEMLRYS
ncbi:peptidase domain-containing ABC transporter [Noviherbaspirillum aridicola]|uniref:Colicin V biosynthesis protein n=1 Tax=Noviherbaspirillum aridicola TaxID=2849687 RepID=A0ABQ4Q8U5_9BURK|nr:peptidase domain-containing ABC transporter [Noviherbaspirillum aridicola]GIZ53637.1 colicin V biosynthesis protein [Noviherbaspirillum aridicola]